RVLFRSEEEQQDEQSGVAAQVVDTPRGKDEEHAKEAEREDGAAQVLPGVSEEILARDITTRIQPGRRLEGIDRLRRPALSPERDPQVVHQGPLRRIDLEGATKVGLRLLPAALAQR